MLNAISLTALKLKNSTLTPFLVTSLLTFAVPVQALTWSASERVVTTKSPGNMGFLYQHPNVKMDATGNSIYTWFDQQQTAMGGQIWSKSRSNTGAWSVAGALDAAANNFNLPQVEISLAGNATAVWLNLGHMWTADKPAGKSWSIPVDLGYGYSPKISLNGKGDALLVFIGNGGITAMHRVAGEVWRLPETVASGNFIKDVVLADNGDALVAWDTVTMLSPRMHILTSSTLHVSRQAKGNTAWQDSGQITNPFTLLNGIDANARLLVDAQGRAGVFFHNLDSNDLYVATQNGAGQVWSLPKAVLSVPGCIYAYSGCVQHSFSLNNDAVGNVNIITTVADVSTTIFQLVETSVNGNLATNTWNKPRQIVLVNDPLYDIGINGDAVKIWAMLDKAGNRVVQTAARPRTTSVWGTTKTLASLPAATLANHDLNAVGVSVNAQGKAEVLYADTNLIFDMTQFTSTTTDTLYAVSLR